MSPSLIAGLEASLVLGGVLALAVWELIRLRREQARDARRVDRPGDDQKATDREEER